MKKSLVLILAISIWACNTQTETEPGIDSENSNQRIFSFCKGKSVEGG